MNETLEFSNGNPRPEAIAFGMVDDQFVDHLTRDLQQGRRGYGDFARPVREPEE